MANLITRTTPLYTDLAILLFRLLFGGMFIFMGYLKIEGFDQYATMFPNYVGLGSKLTYILVTLAEFGGGILIVLGFLTRVVIIPIFVIVTVAFLVAHKKDPFLAKQLVFVYICLAPVLFLLGSGRFSLDHLVFGKKNTNTRKQYI